MGPPVIHAVFDLIAVGSALAAGYLVYRWRLRAYVQTISTSMTGRYYISLWVGSVTGAFLFGSLNLLLSGQPGIGRSILGALAGAILAVEIYKRRKGIVGSTGVAFVAPFATLVAVGRIGCLLSGLDDYTHGAPTGRDWGWDYGDGVPRHPVQLYETLAMTAFLLTFLVLLARRSPVALRHGFYLCVGCYGLQRFMLEFLKPYGSVFGPFNLFHLLCFGLVLYALGMTRRMVDARA